MNFDDLIGTPPPSTVDIGRIVRRQRRLLRMRAITAAVAVAVAIGTGFVLRPQSHSNIDIAATASPADVNAAWTAATERVAPGATWASLTDRMVRDTAPPLVMLEAGLHHVAGEIEFGGILGRFTIFVRSGPTALPTEKCAGASGPPCWPDSGICPEGHSCSEAQGPNGTTIKVRRSTHTLIDFDVPMEMLVVAVYQPGSGRIAMMTVTNQPGWNEHPHPSTDLPLTEEQVKSILLEPGLLP